MRALYIHIPFCKTICSYCDFCKFLLNEELVNKYLDVLNNEIIEYYEGDTIKSIYIGGGTPSCIGINNINKLFNMLNIIKKSENIEITFECNINDINEELLNVLKDNGVNRLSIGIESFNKNNLAFMDRNHDKNDVVKSIKLAKNYFDNINADLIYALPDEKLFTLKRDLNEILKLDIQHISTYSLIIEEHTKIYNQKVKQLDEETDYKMYKYICNKLRKKGFHHYEVSNFSLFSFESKHNLTYWDNDEYYGFGLSSHGYINAIRYENTRNFNKYLNGNYRLNELLISSQEEMENFMILGLRKLDGISISEFYYRFDKDIFEVFKLDEAIKKGYIVKDNNMLYIPESKIYIMNEILNLIL